jgi:hypothetical protein
MKTKVIIEIEYESNFNPSLDIAMFPSVEERKWKEDLSQMLERTLKSLDRTVKIEVLRPSERNLSERVRR